MNKENQRNMFIGIIMVVVFIIFGMIFKPSGAVSGNSSAVWQEQTVAKSIW